MKIQYEAEDFIQMSQDPQADQYQVLGVYRSILVVKNPEGVELTIGKRVYLTAQTVLKATLL